MLREQEAGAKTADPCRRHGISSATFYAWKEKFCGMEVSDAKRLKAIDDENIKLKRFLVDAILDASVRKNLLAKMMTPSAVREAVVNVLREQDVGERRACSIIGADRSAIRCRSRRSDDALLRGRPRELASERRRFS